MIKYTLSVKNILFFLVLSYIILSSLKMNITENKLCTIGTPPGMVQIKQ
jgi:hypothetical protein